MIADLATFAARYNIGPDVAYVLPALFDNAAKKAGLPVRALIAQATYSNPALGEYLAGCARTVATNMKGA